MRVWLQKQKKKEENKAASQVVTPVVDTVPAPSDSQPTEAVSEKPVETVEVESKPNHAAAEPVIVESVSEEPQRPASAASQTKEVRVIGFIEGLMLTLSRMLIRCKTMKHRMTTKM